MFHRCANKTATLPPRRVQSTRSTRSGSTPFRTGTSDRLFTRLAPVIVKRSHTRDIDSSLQLLVKGVGEGAGFLSLPLCHLNILWDPRFPFSSSLRDQSTRHLAAKISIGLLRDLAGRGWKSYICYYGSVYWVDSSLYLLVYNIIAILGLAFAVVIRQNPFDNFRLANGIVHNNSAHSRKLYVTLTWGVSWQFLLPILYLLILEQSGERRDYSHNDQAEQCKVQAVSISILYHLR